MYFIKLLNSFKRTKFWFLILKYFIAPSYNFIWSYLINFKSKLLYKSASGGAEHLKIFKVSNINTSLKFLKTKNFWVSAFDISANKDFTNNDWKGRNVLLFGSEGFGLKSKTLMHSDFKFKVKMNNNIESLNISNTVSVVCHHIYQSIK